MFVSIHFWQDFIAAKFFFDVHVFFFFLRGTLQPASSASSTFSGVGTLLLSFKGDKLAKEWWIDRVARQQVVAAVSGSPQVEVFREKYCIVNSWKLRRCFWYVFNCECEALNFNKYGTKSWQIIGHFNKITSLQHPPLPTNLRAQQGMFLRVAKNWSKLGTPDV